MYVAREAMRIRTCALRLGETGHFGDVFKIFNPYSGQKVLSVRDSGVC